MLSRLGGAVTRRCTPPQRRQWLHNNAQPTGEGVDRRDVGDDADDLDVLGIGDAAVQHSPVPGMREPAGIGDDGVDHLDPVARQLAATVMPPLDRVGRQRRFAPRAQRTARRLPGLGRDLDAGRAVEPCARARQPVPGTRMRGGEIGADRIRRSLVGHDQNRLPRHDCGTPKWTWTSRPASTGVPRPQASVIARLRSAGDPGSIAAPLLDRGIYLASARCNHGRRSSGNICLVGRSRAA